MLKGRPITRSPLPQPGKRGRPPTLNIAQAIERRPSIQVETETPVSSKPRTVAAYDEEDDETLQLSSPESSGPISPIIPVLKTDAGDEILKDLQELDELRKSVKQNLKLRPIKSRTNLRLDGSTPSPASSAAQSFSDNGEGTSSSSIWSDRDGSLDSATSTTSNYFTPTGEGLQASSFMPAATPSASESFPILDELTPRPPTAVSPRSLYERLTASKRPLLIDTRPLAAHEAFHIRHSINVAIPSLILRRSKKPGGGFQTMDGLRQFITTDEGKRTWDELMRQPGGAWDGDVVIYDDDMDLKDRDNLGVTAWAIMPVITPLLSYGTVDYLEGGLSSAGHDPDLQTLIVTGDEASSKPEGGQTQVSINGPPSQLQQQQQQQQHKPPKKGAGLFQLDTQTTYRNKNLPEIEPQSTLSALPPSGLLPIPPRSPLPMMPTSVSSSSPSSHSGSSNSSLTDSPSPPPSSLAGFRRPPPPRRPSAPNLRAINTKSMERLTLNTTDLPKLSLRKKPMRSATVGGPPTLTLQVPTSPTQLRPFHPSPSTPKDNGLQSALSPSNNDPRNFMTPYYTPPHTPKAAFASFGAPHHPPGLHPSHLPLDPPPTARPNFDDQPPTTEEDPYPEFTISTILPNFLFLGPEITTKEQMVELQELGVKRILNIAAECDDDHGLGLRQQFDKYLKIPMRDTVEEDNITRGVREVCDFLGQSSSFPAYDVCATALTLSITVSLCR